MLTYDYIPIFLYNGYLTLFYSTVFTNLPVFSLIFDIDLTQMQMYNYPVLYAVVQQYFGLTGKNFCINILKSLYQGFVIYTLSLFLIESYLTKIVTCSFTALILIQMLNVYTKIKSFNYFIYFSIVLSLLIYLYSLLFLKSFFMLGQMGKYDSLIVLFIVLIAWFPF
jgi:phospholipid-translocating ATPase